MASRSSRSRAKAQLKHRIPGLLREPFSLGASMGWWFGRKSAPADARPFVPAWLSTDSAEEGFARSYEAQFDEVYRRNPVGQRAVRLLSGMLGSLTVDGDQRAVTLIKSDRLLETV